MDLGQHAAFIILSYLAVAITVAGLIIWLVMDGRKQARGLADLQQRGIRRRTVGTPE